MKLLKNTLSVLLLGVIFIFTSLQVYAAQATQLQEQASQALVRLEIMQKDKKGSLRLTDKTKRAEFITFINAAMSYDIETDSAATDIEFKDLTKKQTAYLQFKAAAANDLINAYEDGTIRPDKVITTGDSLAILLKALGYGDDFQDQDHDSIVKMAAELGITGEARIKYDDPLVRGNAAIYLFRFMTIDFKD